MIHTSSRKFILVFAFAAAGSPLFCGCGTTRSSDTMRTATEQLLISGAIDRAVQTVDFQPLAGQTVFLDDSRLADVVDSDYLVSTLRQHLLASGCVLRDERATADFIVEARAGAVGTDRNDLLFGIPATNVPQILPFQTLPAAIPEVPLAKRRDQRGIAKISMFAYHRETGTPVWQSGLAIRESSSNDVWLFGAGPFQHGNVYDGPVFADRKQDPNSKQEGPPRHGRTQVDLADEATFASPAKLVKQFNRLPTTTAVAQAEQSPPKTSAPLAEVASNVAAPAPLPHENGDAQLLVPSLADTLGKVKQNMTTRVYGSPLRRQDRTKTVDMVPPRETDPITLPQPRFDSL